MRTHLIHAAMAVVVVLVVASSASAQSRINTVVLDDQGRPIEDATVTMVAVEGISQMTGSTNARGEFETLGLAPGAYAFTVTKDDMTSRIMETLTMARPLELEFILAPTSGLTPEQIELQEEMNDLAVNAVAAMNEGREADAIQMFNDVIANRPNCSDCFYNLGVAYSNQQQYDEAAGAFQRTVQIAPDNAEAYTGLANVYNIQQKFDLAAEASTMAANLGTGGDATASYNQGVILWNAGNFADAKAQFETAIAADPTIGDAYYQLGMANLNLGMIPEARQAFEGYLQAAPDGEKVAEVNGFLQQLPQ